MRTMSLQRRLGLTLGVLLSVLWIVAASVTAYLARQAMEEVFDSALQEMAQRIMPLAVVEVLGREPSDLTQRMSLTRNHDELLTYVVRDREGRVLLRSHDADPEIFPPWKGTGFSQTIHHRFYSEEALQGSVRLTVAEPLAHRSVVAHEIQMGLGLPLVIFLPLAIVMIVLSVRYSLAPLHSFRNRLANRGVRDFSPVPTSGLPTEVTPVANTLNDLLKRLGAAFEAERNFAANAAHELRTPLSGALAQVQRLKTETQDQQAKARAAEIDLTLKRLTRLSERLVQLARAEGGRLRLDRASDLRPVAQILTDDLSRLNGPGKIFIDLPASPVLSDLDPDIFAIIYRNLVENALRHGAVDMPVGVSLSNDGLLIVDNDGPVVPKDVLSRLTDRFERLDHGSDGSGLGLAIVNAVADRVGGKLSLQSPRPGWDSGFQASVRIPVVGER